MRANEKSPDNPILENRLTGNEASAVQVPQVGLIEQSSELFNTFLGAREGASAEGGFVLRYANEGLKAKMGRIGGAQRANEKSPGRAI